MDDPYVEGYEARLDGRPVTENPHQPETVEREDWRGGWHDADADVDAGDAEEEA